MRACVRVDTLLQSILNIISMSSCSNTSKTLMLIKVRNCFGLLRYSSYCIEKCFSCVFGNEAIPDYEVILDHRGTGSERFYSASTG